MGVQVGLQNDGRRLGVERCLAPPPVQAAIAQARFRFDRGQAFVDQRHRQVVAAFELAGAAMVVKGWAAPSIISPTATPMRRMPKSKASTNLTTT